MSISSRPTYDAAPLISVLRVGGSYSGVADVTGDLTPSPGDVVREAVAGAEVRLYDPGEPH